MDLTKDQIQYLENFIDKSGINYSHLRDDLLDHMCCDIEYRMESGESFKDAFDNVLLDCSMSHLAHLQKQTLLLTNKFYSAMKKIVQIFGVLVPLIITAGAMAKVYHWPGAAALLVLGFLFLNFLLIPALSVVSYTEFNDKKYLTPHITVGISAFILSFGLLFKIMHWPGANILLLAGGVLLLLNIPFLLISVKRKLQPESIIIPAIIGIIALLTGLQCKMMHWPGASWIIVGSLVYINVFLVPKYILSKSCTPARSLFVIVVSIWITIGSMMSFYNTNKNCDSYYTAQAEKLNADNEKYSALLTKSYSDSTNAEAIESFISSYNNVDYYLSKNSRERGHAIVPNDLELLELYNNYISEYEKVQEVTGGKSNLYKLDKGVPMNYIHLYSNVLLLHQNEIIKLINQLSTQKGELK